MQNDDSPRSFVALIMHQSRSIPALIGLLSSMIYAKFHFFESREWYRRCSVKYETYISSAAEIRFASVQYSIHGKKPDFTIG